MNVSDLKHTRKDLPGGGMVLILETGAVVTPEDEAMLQALHSRSIGGILSHLKTLERIGSGKLMKNFYVGYGHKSIGDCGHGIIFIEGVSMLAAKAIQDWRLYNGQEASTRYIDFANQKFADPIGTDSSHELLEELRGLYLGGLEPTKEMFRGRHPYQKQWDEKEYEKTINARAFDVMRGFLPAGATTNLSWSSNLRQIADKLMMLRHHPLTEVKEIASAMENGLVEHFQNSFGHKMYKETESYNGWWMGGKYYYKPMQYSDLRFWSEGIDQKLLSQEYGEAMAKRPPKTELPREIAECGTMRIEFLLDFGSYRDIQRQRSVVQRMPLHSAGFGFHNWYIENIPKRVRNIACPVLEKISDRILNITTDKFIGQYYVPMGFMSPNRIVGDLHALTYIAELRATRFVHPTLRQRAFQIAQILEDLFGKYGLKIYTDQDPNIFDVKRGKQDIVKK